MDSGLFFQLKVEEISISEIKKFTVTLGYLVAKSCKFLH